MGSSSKEETKVLRNSEKNALFLAIIVVVTMFAFYFGWERGAELAQMNSISISISK